MFGRRKSGPEAEPVEAETPPDDDRPAPAAAEKPHLEGALALIRPIIEARFDRATAARVPRRELAREVKEIVTDIQTRGRIKLNGVEARDLVTSLVTGLVGPGQDSDDASEVEEPEPAPATRRPRPPMSMTQSQPAGSTPLGGARALATARDRAVESLRVPAKPAPAPEAPKHDSTLQEAKRVIQPILMERIDASAAAQLPRAELARQIGTIILEITAEQKIHLNMAEQRDLVTMLINDMLGLGPLEPLLADEAITDIMVNGPNQVYIERRGKLELTNVRFKDNAQLINIASRIVTRIGRRVDDSSPLCDARLEDGSRVNIIIPPLAIDGASISIRKFAKKSITLDIMAQTNNISTNMATVLKIAARSRLNILISGGTGSGKTTLLNAMSQLIDHGERIVTIEDAAELQLQQPHVVRLETRPANLEGQGEITMRDLVKNALRMRPDRIILGEVRSHEAVDMLQAMNTGHEGSMCTIHANRPREALTRLENMIGMAGINLPSKAVRTQVAAAIDVIVQVSRMRDGMRRVTSITEVVGMEDEVITTQELYRFEFQGEDANGRLLGKFVSSGLRPHFLPKAEYFGLDRALLEAMT
jgi:pilus assembly protein CpaF